MPTAEMRAPPALRRRLAGMVTERLPYKLAALFFALVLWLVVSAEESAEELVPVRFAPMLDSGVALASPQPAVRALVIGRARELLKLYATPPTVRRVFGRDTPDTVQLVLRPSDVDLPVGVDAIVHSVEPSAISLRFVTTLARRVPVRLAVRVFPDATLRGSAVPRAEPESVTVIGPRAAVSRVASVRTVEQTLSLGSEGVLVPLDTARLGAEVRPASVRVTILPAAGARRDSGATLEGAAAPSSRAGDTTRAGAGRRRLAAPGSGIAQRGPAAPSP